MAKVLFWFRRDLRLNDNRGLRRARDRADSLYTCFTVDSGHADWEFGCGDRLGFKLDCLTGLREQIREGGGELLVRRGQPAAELVRLARELDVDAVHWNRAYEPYELERDRRAKEKLNEAGVEVETWKDQVMFEREEIMTKQGTAYKVFSPYARNWKTREKPEPVEKVEKFERPEAAEPGLIPEPEALGVTTKLDSLEWTASEAAARKRWCQFQREGLEDYHENRDFPAREGTSGLSPYLRFGLLSIRELYRDCREKYDDFASYEGIETFVDELIWRDFYHQIIYNYPHVAGSSFKEKYQGFKWNDDAEALERWKQGRTGYPIVDAAMRQLNRTGWMHNRLRMISAMFLTKDLLVDWRLGEKYFMRRLVDGDVAANNGGWQWSASTGADGAPYFRIFNPVSQAEKYDPDGEFVRRFCPELEALEAPEIHAPFEVSPERLGEVGIELGEDYPEPVVDHSVRREVALNRLQDL